MVPSALQQAGLALRRFVADLQMLSDEERKGGGSRSRLNMWCPKMISGLPVYFRAAPCVTAGITGKAGHGTCPRHRRRRRRSSGGGRARAARRGSRRARCPPGRSARCGGSSSARPVCHHGLSVSVQRREGAAPPGGCPEPRRAQRAPRIQRRAGLH